MLKRILEITLVMLVAVWIFGSYKTPESKNKNPENFQTPSEIGVPTTLGVENTSIEKVENKTATTIETNPKPKVGQVKISVKPKPVIVVKVPEIVATSPTPAPLLRQDYAGQAEPPPDFEKINTFARMATINILCTAKGNEFSPISGTGIVISPNGLILTNAHVAQYFLLGNLYTKDFIQCSIRTGSPAYPRYHAELVYISPTWVEANKTELKQDNPKGTGQNDFAFLRIIDAIDSTTLPTFSYIPINTREVIDLNEPVVLVSYPAGFLGGLSILQGLSVTSAVTVVQDIFTFKSNTIDVISVGGTVVSQKGASGGAVVDKHSTLIGIISTSSNGNTTSSRELNAITLGYISRTLQTEIGYTLSNFLSLDIPNFAKSFQNTTAVSLTKILTDELTKTQ